MVAKRLSGVGLIVQNFEGKILILQEFETKLHIGKRAGMFSIPMETLQPGESDFYALIRLAREELPGIRLPFEKVLSSYVGRYRIVPRVWVNLYSVIAEDDRLPDSGGEEVGNHQWMRPKKAIDLWLRQGAREMIRDFINNKKNVFCWRCRIPDRISKLC